MSKHVKLLLYIKSSPVYENEEYNVIEITSAFYPGGYSKSDAPKITYNGFEFYAQTRGYVSSVISGVKNDNPKYVSEIANFIAPQLKESCILIPAPQHTGKAIYTLHICEQIKNIRTDLNIEIQDILTQTAKENTLRDLKKTMKKNELSQYDLGIAIKDNQLSDLPKYLVDNTISTGKTFDSIKALIPDIQPLAFSLGSQFLKSH